MPRYWVIAPYGYEDRETFKRAWSYDLANGVIAIGWSEIGDPSRLSEEELLQALKQTHPKSARRASGILWRFYHEVQPGDIVVARRGRKTIAAIGTVAGKAFYSEEKGKERVGPDARYFCPNFLPVRWQEQPRDKELQGIPFAITTLYEISEQAFEKLMAGEVQEPSPAETRFELEKYLEEFIVSNFDAIFKRRLELFQDDDGVKGRQYETGVGRIDILAKERSTGALVVVELKKGQGADEVMGQVLRYMGWVQEHLCQEGQPVKGMIVCRQVEPTLQYALNMVRNVEAWTYRVHFELTPWQPGAPA
ncbi:Endonuclease NucS [bacterium HR23]|nr:Endonuclease NucS [bacterium HR23]